MYLQVVIVCSAAAVTILSGALMSVEKTAEIAEIARCGDHKLPT